MKKFIMNSKVFFGFIFCSAIIYTGCQKSISETQELKQNNQQSAAARVAGETQVSAVGVYAAVGECTSPDEKADYILSITGDFAGCLYTYVDAYRCSPGGTYREEGREHFVGIYNGKEGSFWTSYKFESKFEACSPSGAPLGGEIKGRCQHPITVGSGKGVFDGVTGRLDMKDNIEGGNFIIRGHFLF